MSDNATYDDLRPHTPTHVCARCRKPFSKGHRVGHSFIFDRAGANPMNLHALGVHLGEEYELIHIDCNDPFLRRGPGNQVVLV